MTTWQTTIPISKPPFAIALGGKFYNLGSCFSTHLNKALQENLFNVYSSPYGIEYNMVSMAQGLNRILNQNQFTEEEVIKTSLGYTTYQHHKLQTKTSPEELLQNLNNENPSHLQALLHADFLCLTPGTAFVYFKKSSDNPVNNCHKMPSSHFERRLCSIDETTQTFLPILTKLKRINQKLKFILSLSPVKHLRDDATENSLSKSICRICLEEIKNHFKEDAYYFPSFEIVTDELRDYRFYDESMTHPSEATTKYIIERFFQSCLDAKAKTFYTSWQSILKFLNHKPYEPSSQEHKKSLELYKERISTLKTEYPQINWANFEKLFRL